jgi:predicted acylesterase/phospholipase RssA
MFPKRLIFSGGGTQCLVFLPTLLQLEKRNQLVHVHEWWGTSAGALLASLMSLTRSASRVDTIIRETDFTRFRDVNLMNLVEFKTSWGFDDGKSLVREVERVLELAKSGSSKLKLSDIEGVHIVVCDMNDHKTIVCSAKTYPDLRLVDALRASMSLPFFYTPFRNPENGHIWVDGGVNANFAWPLLPKDAQKESLGFAFERSWMKGPRTLSEYIFSILHFGDPKKINSLKQAWPKNILWFQSPPFPAWYVRIQKEEYAMMEQLSMQGYQKWLTACSSEIAASRRVCEGPHTPPQSHQACTDELSDTPLSPSLRRQPCLSQDSQSQTPQVFRRWSV